jgi:hypothetical protein
MSILNQSQIKSKQKIVKQRKKKKTKNKKQKASIKDFEFFTWLACICSLMLSEKLRFV